MRFMESRRNGSTFLVLIIGITVLSILGASLTYIMRERHYQVVRHGRALQAASLAESGVDMALFKLKNIFSRRLCTPIKPAAGEIQKVDGELLDLLDSERARDWARHFSIEDDSLSEGGKISVTMEMLQVSRVPFGSYIDKTDIVPRALKQYKAPESDEDSGFGHQPLGGWVGKLRIVSVGEFADERRVLEVYKDIKVLDISPPAPDHTLFISGEGTDTIKEGRFTMSNLNLPLEVRDLLFDLGNKVNEILKLEMSESKANTVQNIDKIVKLLTTEADEDDMHNALRLIHDLSKYASDEAIKDTVDNIILSLDPRDWGRVRTNGVLYVYLPFFAADDIINYFADSSYFGHQRPEVGYLYCENRLHDPYLSVYTHYEGYIYKHYQRLNPLVLGPSEKAQAVPPQRYTINTRPDYVRRYPDRKDPRNLKRIHEQGRKQAHRVISGNLFLKGTPDNPITLGGLWFCTGKVTIGGPYTGRGMIVSEKEIVVTDDLVRSDDISRLSLVSLKQHIELDSRKQYWKIQGGLCADKGITGRPEQDLKVFGNLVVSALNREKMPKFFTCRFDSNLKNHGGDNLVGQWGKRPLIMRYCGSSFDETVTSSGADAVELNP